MPVSLLVKPRAAGFVAARFFDAGLLADFLDDTFFLGAVFLAGFFAVAFFLGAAFALGAAFRLGIAAVSG